MSNTTIWLLKEIAEFIVVLNTCLDETNFVEDRHLYADDIAVAVDWLNRLQAGTQAVVIASQILESSTSKHFTEYWRQGAWGEMESKALADLQSNIRSKLKFN